MDGTVEPLATVHAEDVAWFDLDLGRDVRMPPVVANDLLIGELLRGIEGKHFLSALDLLMGLIWRARSATRRVYTSALTAPSVLSRTPGGRKVLTGPSGLSLRKHTCRADAHD